MELTKQSVLVTLFNMLLIKIINGTVHDLDLEAKHPPFDPKIYEDALDPALCAKQVRYLITDGTMLMATCKYF